MSENKWRFNSNGGNKVNGLETADINTFLKDSMASLAREICQNSIDAKDQSNDNPVRLEFHTFEMESAKIPGYKRLVQEFDHCKEYWKDDFKTHTKLNKMQQELMKLSVTCLRMSDFNTTGLSGISDFTDKRSHWISLLHGSGMSEKNGATGGAKGIGKYATFTNSLFRTVFYITHTDKGEKGYEGMSYLCTGVIPESEKGEVTEGLGYYGSDDVNNPILEDLTLDDGFHGRDNNEAGTDIYILGFNNSGNWKKEIISKILESFMVAIAFGKLIVTVDDTVINKTTLKDIVYNPDFVSGNTLTKTIVSQYILLSGDPEVNIDHLDIELEGEVLGTVDLYSKELKGEQAKYATNKCVMIRYPYMKIKDTKQITNNSMSVSALCIINNDELNKRLKAIENPQHTDWEYNRITEPEIKDAIKNVISQMNKKIADTVFDHIQSAAANSTDNTTASEYLPASGNDDEGDVSETAVVPVTKVHITPHKNKVRTAEINTSVDDPDGNGVGMDLVDDDNKGDYDINHTGGSNGGKGAGTHTGDEEGKGNKDDSGHEGFVRESTRGTSYRFFCTNKSTGTYVLMFVSLDDVANGELELDKLDIAGGKESVQIDEAINNLTGEALTVLNKKTIKLKSKQNEKIVVKITTPYTDLFASEAHYYRVVDSNKVV